MDIRRCLFGALTLFVTTLALACSDPEGFNNVPDDCPNAPTNPECQDYCDTDPTAAWCAEADSGNNTSANNDAGNTDAATSPSDADTVPCDGACSNGEVCDEASDTCVECLSAGDCLDGVCQLDAADSSNNRCVACLADADCVTGVCDTDSNACVPCLADADCSEADAAKCVLGATTADNACGGCDESSQCAGIAGTEVCDVGDGTCVECLDDSDTTRAACGGNSCDPETNECTQTQVGMTGVCEECAADSECAEGFACVELEFEGQPAGAYCLREFTTTCNEPYGTLLTRSSLSDATTRSFCGISENRTTCPAVLDLGSGKSCVLQDMGMECGDPRFDDAVCVNIVGVPTCSYECTADRQCPTVCNMTNSVCDEDP